MSRRKQKITKMHVTATIDRVLVVAIDKFRKDKKNYIDISRKSKDGKTIQTIKGPMPISQVHEKALYAFLQPYLPGSTTLIHEPESINTTPANNDTVASESRETSDTIPAV